MNKEIACTIEKNLYLIYTNLFYIEVITTTL